MEKITDLTYISLVKSNMIELLYLKENLSDISIAEGNPEASEEEKLRPEKKILCRKCHSYIAETDDKIKINDSDFHLFKNPLGIYFRVICLKKAAGCIVITEYTEDYTWFKGFSWSIALCGTCHTHLGWHYKSGSSMFYGLIADRLTGI